MGTRQLLSVTCFDEYLEEGVSYQMALAKAMNEYIVILLEQNKNNIMNGLGNLMTAANFTDAEEKKITRQIMTEGSKETDGRFDRKIGDLLGQGTVSTSRMNRTPKPKHVLHIFARSPGSIHMLPSLSIKSSQ
jgi:hypothetical protein